MSLPDQNSFNPHIGNGVVRTFAYTFKILEETDLKVYVNGAEQALTTDYQISGVGVETGGTVTFSSPPANAAKVLILRYVPFHRVTDYQQQGDLFAETLNNDFDRVWMAAQQLRRDSTRSVKLPLGVSAEVPNTPDSFLFIDTSGNITARPFQEFVDRVNITPDTVSRTSAAAAAAVTYPDGTIVRLGGLDYRVDSSATGINSATYDLGVDGLLPAFNATFLHYGAKGDFLLETGIGNPSPTDDADALIRALSVCKFTSIDGLGRHYLTSKGVEIKSCDLENATFRAAATVDVSATNGAILQRAWSNLLKLSNVDIYAGNYKALHLGNQSISFIDNLNVYSFNSVGIDIQSNENRLIGCAITQTATPSSGIHAIRIKQSRDNKLSDCVVKDGHINLDTLSQNYNQIVNTVFLHTKTPLPESCFLATDSTTISSVIYPRNTFISQNNVSAQVQSGAIKIIKLGLGSWGRSAEADAKRINYYKINTNSAFAFSNQSNQITSVKLLSDGNSLPNFSLSPEKSVLYKVDIGTNKRINLNGIDLINDSLKEGESFYIGMFVGNQSLTDEPYRIVISGNGFLLKQTLVIGQHLSSHNCIVKFTKINGAYCVETVQDYDQFKPDLELKALPSNEINQSSITWYPVSGATYYTTSAADYAAPRNIHQLPTSDYPDGSYFYLSCRSGNTNGAIVLKPHPSCHWPSDIAINNTYNGKLIKIVKTGGRWAIG